LVLVLVLVLVFVQWQHRWNMAQSRHGDGQP